MGGLGKDTADRVGGGFRFMWLLTAEAFINQSLEIILYTFYCHDITFV